MFSIFSYIKIWNRMTASVLKQDPNTKSFKQKKSFSFIFHHYWPFICRLSVVLWLDKGDFPENLHTVCVLNKRSFESFCVWIFSYITIISWAVRISCCVLLFFEGGGGAYQIFMSSDFSKTIAILALTVPRVKVKLAIHFYFYQMCTLQSLLLTLVTKTYPHTTWRSKDVDSCIA